MWTLWTFNNKPDFSNVTGEHEYIWVKLQTTLMPKLQVPIEPSSAAAMNMTSCARCCFSRRTHYALLWALVIYMDVSGSLQIDGVPNVEVKGLLCKPQNLLSD